MNAAIFFFLCYSWSFGDFGCLHPLYQKTQLRDMRMRCYK
jgi:hypothetical protein